MKIIRLKGGTYCDVFRYKNGRREYVIKFFGDGKISNKVGDLIISDYIRLKTVLEKFKVSVPKTFKIYLSSVPKGEIVIIEQFCGISLREILGDSKIQSFRKIDFIKLVLKFIAKLPEGIPLDTNPGNFVINKRGRVTFVDLVPPEPWKYIKNKLIEKELDKIFPGMNVNIYQDKYKSYHTNKYRKKRFLYHCKVLLDKVEKVVQTDNINP